MRCTEANLPICYYCSEGNTRVCTFTFYEVYLNVLKQAPPDEAREVLIDKVKKGACLPYISYILKHQWQDRYDWFQSILLLK